MLLNKKKASWLAMFSKLQESCFGMLGGFSLSLYKFSTQISMVSSTGIFVNKESMSRLAMCKWQWLTSDLKMTSVSVETLEELGYIK